MITLDGSSASSGRQLSKGGDPPPIWRVVADEQCGQLCRELRLENFGGRCGGDVVVVGGREDDRKWLLCAGRWIAAGCANFDLDQECARSGMKKELHKLQYLR